MLEIFSSPDTWVSLFTLTALEIVLGIDNVIFITILAGKLPKEERKKATRLGLAGALLSRLALLGAISWVTKLTTPLFTVMGYSVSGRDLVLIAGGLFLIAKATFEIYDKVEAAHPLVEEGKPGRGKKLASVVGQIMLLDIVFSLDSVITAVGMVDHIEIMVLAVIIAIVVMLAFATSIGNFVEKHPEHQDPGPLVPGDDRSAPGGRGHRAALQAGLCLFRHGVQSGDRAHQHEVPGPPQSAPGLSLRQGSWIFSTRAATGGSSSPRWKRRQKTFSPSTRSFSGTRKVSSLQFVPSGSDPTSWSLTASASV